MTLSIVPEVVVLGGVLVVMTSVSVSVVLLVPLFPVLREAPLLVLSVERVGDSVFASVVL